MTTTPTPTTPITTPTNRPTRKVTVASIAAYLGFVGIDGILEAVHAHPMLIAGAPSWVTILITPLIPAALAFVGGWLTRHAPRDLPDQGGSTTP